MRFSKLLGILGVASLLGAGCESPISISVYENGRKSEYKGMRRDVGYQLVKEHNARFFLLHSISSTNKDVRFYCEVMIGTNCYEASDLDLKDCDCSNGVSRLPLGYSIEEIK